MHMQSQVSTCVYFSLAVIMLCLTHDQTISTVIYQLMYTHACKINSFMFIFGEFHNLILLQQRQHAMLSDHQRTVLLPLLPIYTFDLGPALPLVVLQEKVEETQEEEDIQTVQSREESGGESGILTARQI